MSGTVSLDSQDGRGSTFSLSFPRVAPPSPHSHVADAPLDGEALEKRARYAGLVGQQEPSTTRRGTRGPLVVVAEDDADLRTQLIELLQSHYRVLAFDNGRSAYDAVLEHRPHLVLTDVMMPEMDGLELARMLRGRPELRDTPLVLLTARSAVEHRIEGRQEAIDAYLTKPFHPKELLATLDGLLRSRMRLLGSYLVLEKLGGGGQGEVFRGEHLESRERVAIKVMPSASASTDTERAALLELRHPNIVRILEEGASGNRCYLAVEYLEGQSLSELIGLRGTLSPPQVSHILLALANALACVHESGLIHGDVKPSNVMVLCGRTDLRGRVRLIDFGAAHHQASPAARDVTGTMPYMAPERIEHGISSPASDLYSLGVCAFRCLTGRLPFIADTPEALTNVVSHGDTPDTRQLLDGTPAPLARIVSTLMAPNPAHRYPSARDLAQVVTESLGTSDVELSVGTRDLDSSTVALDPRRSSTHRR